MQADVFHTNQRAEANGYCALTRLLSSGPPTLTRRLPSKEKSILCTLPYAVQDREPVQHEAQLTPPFRPEAYLVQSQCVQRHKIS